MSLFQSELLIPQEIHLTCNNIIRPAIRENLFKCVSPYVVVCSFIKNPHPLPSQFCCQEQEPLDILWTCLHNNKINRKGRGRVSFSKCSIVIIPYFNYFAACILDGNFTDGLDSSFAPHAYYSYVFIWFNVTKVLFIDV